MLNKIKKRLLNTQRVKINGKVYSTKDPQVKKAMEQIDLNPNIEGKNGFWWVPRLF